MNWKLWNEFCKVTNKENVWGQRITSLLLQNKLLPSNSILDIGCGSGEFTNWLAKYAKDKCIGFDTYDSDIKKDFTFKQSTFEEWEDFDFDLVVFKQSFHLLENPFKVSARIKAPIVIIQMPQPRWEKTSWENTTLCYLTNVERFLKLNKDVEVFTLEEDFLIDPEFHKRMILEGYCSALYKKSSIEREEIWKSIEDKNTFKDILKVIIVK